MKQRSKLSKEMIQRVESLDRRQLAEIRKLNHPPQAIKSALRVIYLIQGVFDVGITLTFRFLWKYTKFERWLNFDAVLTRFSSHSSVPLVQSAT